MPQPSLESLKKHKADYSRKLQKALAHLDYSYKKVKPLPTNPATMDEEQLEVWESFASRFSRVADIFITRYLRTRVLLEDPAFSGTVRDTLNFAEKKQWVESAEDWLAIRELRNLSEHDYTEEELEIFFKKIKGHAPLLLKLNIE